MHCKAVLADGQPRDRGPQINVCLNARVAHHGQGLAAVPGNFRSQFIQSVFTTSLDHHRSACLREGQSCGPSYARAGAGNDGCLVGEKVICRPLNCSIIAHSFVPLV